VLLYVIFLKAKLTASKTIAGHKIISIACQNLSEWGDKKNWLKTWNQLETFCKRVLKLADDDNKLNLGFDTWPFSFEHSTDRQEGKNYLKSSFIWASMFLLPSALNHSYFAGKCTRMK